MFAGLQIAVDDSFSVSRIQRIADLGDILHNPIERQRTLQRPTLDVLHDEIVRADVVERADMGMVQRGYARASRSKRSLNCPAEIFTATMRSRRVSRARYTSPMPPAPSVDRIS